MRTTASAGKAEHGGMQVREEMGGNWGRMEADGIGRVQLQWQPAESLTHISGHINLMG